MGLILYTGRKYFYVLIALVVFSSCETRYTVQDLSEQQRLAENARRAYSLKDPVNVKYKNNTSTVEYAVGKGNEEFVLTMNTDPKFNKDLIDGTLNVSKEAQDAINLALKNYRRAQEFLYVDDYTSALDYVEESLKIIETAEALSLKGSILYVMGDEEKAKALWVQAAKLDPEIRVPSAKELKELSSKK
jgi:tetratricopeptide (TPR) repeat protein